ncbi:MAG: hypothetical protein WBX25_30275, partial [Rhodomicrobium sp.]
RENHDERAYDDVRDSKGTAVVQPKWRRYQPEAADHLKGLFPMPWGARFCLSGNGVLLIAKEAGAED